MYYEKFIPFYSSLEIAPFYDKERLQELEFSKMKSYFPEVADRIQDEVEMECSLLDFEGSRIYDEYPDRRMLEEMAERIQERVEPELEIEGRHRNYLKELIQVLLYHEMSRRRCRRHRCKKIF